MVASMRATWPYLTSEVDMTKQKCDNCARYSLCYPIAHSYDPYPASLVTYMNAIRSRDLCFYNDKDNWISTDKMCGACHKSK